MPAAPVASGRPVLREDRGAPPDGETAADPLVGRQAGEGQARVPGDLAAVERQPQDPVDLAEQPGPDSHPDVDDVLAVDALRAVCAAGIDRGRRRSLLGIEVGALEVGGGVLGLGGVGELIVHRLEVLVGPVVDEPLRHVLLGAARRADHSEDERDQRDDAQGKGALAQPPLALSEGPTLRPRGPGGPPRRLLLPIAGP